MKKLLLVSILPCSALLASSASGQSRLFRTSGTSLMEHHGESVATAGDVDGDGIPDVAVAATGFGGTVGMVQVLAGTDSTPIHHFFGSNGLDYLGRSLDGGEDVDGDGHDDIVAGSPRNSGGMAFVYAGIDGSLLYALDEPTTHTVSFYATAVSLGGDIDGDGLADVLVGGLRLVEVYSGIDGSLVHSVSQPPLAFGFGSAASFVGDLDGDGRADFAVGAPSDESLGNARGAVYVYSGNDASLLFRSEGTRRRDEFGSFVARAGDVNGDGTPDLLVGAEQVVCCRSGFVEVISGVDGSRVHRIDGKAPLDRTNAGSGLGDINGDGFDDFAVGSPGRPVASGGFGEVQVVSGGDGQVLTSLRAGPEQCFYGRSVAGLGDLNSDGVPDFAIGAPGSDDTVNNIDAVGDMEVLSGACFDIRRYCDAGVNSTGKRARMALVGTTSIADDDLALSASGLPPGKPGLFVFGTVQIQVPFGDGFRCVGGSTFRPGPFVHASAGGRVERDFDFGTSPVTAGSAWNFQLWYRDLTATGFNLSDALTVGFCP